jgi:malonyl-CoA/methylmalonyl-CoA synthetase
MSWSARLDATNLPSLFIEKAGRGDVTFATCDDGRVFTYGQFWSLAGNFAAKLKRSGAKPGDRIAVQVDKSIEALALFWAATRGGFVFLPLNPAYTAPEVSYFLGDAGPLIFITTPARLGEMAAVAKATGCKSCFSLGDDGQGTLMEDLSRGDFTDHRSSWDDLAAILYTSGTTGRSKGAMLAHGNLASNALALVDIWRFTENDKLIHALPVYHTHGLFVATNTVIFSGGQLLFRRSFNSDDVIDMMPQATAMMGVPTFYTRLLQHRGLTHEATAHMRVFISGSAPLLADTHRAFRERTGHAILERYGMTETNMNTSNPYDGERVAGTVGFPLPHVEVRLHDGIIEVRGPNVFKGYWRNPEKTKEDMRDDGFFITGDVGHIDDKGYVVISGRAKDLIITGGFNVYPKEIEDAIDAMSGVIESAVIGLPHADFGEAVTAIVATQQSLDEKDMIAQLAMSLAKFKCPKRILFVENLPRNAMGKVQKASLRKIHAALYVN